MSLKMADYNNGLIYTDEEGCIDCNKCIHECPILRSNVSVIDDNGNYKKCVDENECTFCGKCMDTCIHGVRHYKDDLNEFLADLKCGKTVSVLVAPSFYLNYPEDYSKILGYLKSLGVKTFYSVGIGADITTWSCLNYLTNNNTPTHLPTTYISQPCPSIVRYIERHLPELLPNLMPVQSPLMSTAIYLKRYGGITDELAFLSPCVAKKDEIQSKRGLGLISHNITFATLMQHIKDQGVNLESYPCVEDEKGAGLGIFYPQPGGFKENMEYYLGRSVGILQIEGERKAYSYLKTLAERTQNMDETMPALIDVLNCDLGCTYGTATAFRQNGDYSAAHQFVLTRKKKLDSEREESEHFFETHSDRFSALNEHFKDLVLEDFLCEYETETFVKRSVASQEEIETIFREKLFKLTEDDKHIDCSACGYKSCINMAEAIAIGINHHDNCVYFMKNSLADSEVAMRQRLKAMLDASPILCCIYDENYRVIEANSAAAHMFDLTDIDTYINRFFDLCPEYQPDGTPSRVKVPQVLDKALAEGSMQFEWMHQTLDGTPIPCHVNLERVNLLGKNVVMTYVRDLREQNEMIAKLETAYQEMQRVVVAEESNKAKSRFLAKMSHEIRTPITAVLGISEIELQNPRIPDHFEKSFSRIHDASAALLHIINDILDLSKIEAGKTELLCEQYEVTTLIADLTSTYNINVGNKNIKFYVSVAENLPASLLGDIVRIEQVVNNILSNAFKYTIAGSVSFTAACEEDEKGDYIKLVLTVADTGIGMTEKQLNELFNDFSRFHDEEYMHVAGVGLGMPIAYNLVKIMDADIDVKSEPGIGTVVVVSIPQKIVSEKTVGKERALQLERFESNAQRAAKSVTFVPESMPYGKVLIVDDVESNRYVARGLLEFYDIDIDSCESGYEAIEKVSHGKVYDIIFMDYMMPGMDGVEALKKLRELGYIAPIVALTANAMIGQVEELMKHGFDAFLSKPILAKPLNDVLTKFIRDKYPEEAKKTIETMIESIPVKRDEIGIEEYQQSPELLEKLRVDFARSHKNTYKSVLKALDEKDNETAMRLAHTIKGSAGLIQEPELSSVARDVELSIREGKEPTEVQLTAFMTELESVLKRITPGTGTAPDTRQDIEKGLALLGELIPLMEDGNASCLKLVDDLNKITETAVLVRQIETLNFDEAIKTSNTLKDIWEEYR
ncbi:MAG: response regulator [Oscillospiraceae bacterium]|nr:response regulator [Oscillospiraceae bacterium]